MSKFIKISDRRIETFLERLFKSLDEDYHSIISEQNAVGLLRSGGTVKKTVRLVEDNAGKLRTYLIEQSSWAIKKSIYVPLSISEDLVALNEKHNHTYIRNAKKLISKVSILVGKPDLFEKVYPEVAEAINLNIKETKLEIKALVLENRSTGIKGAMKYIFSLVSKL